MNQAEFDIFARRLMWDREARYPRRPPRWPWILAIALGVLLGIYSSNCGTTAQTGFDCAQPGFILTEGRLTQTDSERAAGIYEIDGLTLLPRPNTTGERILATERNSSRTYEVVLRPRLMVK